MATPEKKHNCFLFNFLKGSADPSSAPGLDAETEPPISIEAKADLDQEQTDSNQEQAGNINDTADAPSYLQSEEEQLNAALEEFQADSVAFMDKLPVKYDEQGKPVSSTE
jgi:hypothetical protein